MNAEHRYILEPYKGMSTRYKCPACQHRNKTFSFYIDTQTNLRISERVGRCERIDKCGYHYSPKQYFIDNGIQSDFSSYSTPSRQQESKPKLSFIDPVVFKKSLTGYRINKFVSFLNTLLDQSTVESIIKTYYIGTSNHWPGSTVFWQIDKTGKIRTGKVMLYNPITGKRIKQPHNHINWAHKAMHLYGFNLSQCLFGEHLINLNNKPAAIVESEKTAIIASAYLPQFNWLACGSLQNLSKDRCKVLYDRKTILYPDLNAFEKWSIKAKEMGFSISSLLENIATDSERIQGLDIADYLIGSKQNLTIPHILTKK